MMLFTHLRGQNLANTNTHPRSQTICPDFHGWSSITKDVDILFIKYSSILFTHLQKNTFGNCFTNFSSFSTLCHCKFDGRTVDVILSGIMTGRAVIFYSKVDLCLWASYSISARTVGTFEAILMLSRHLCGQSCAEKNTHPRSLVSRSCGHAGLALPRVWTFSFTIILDSKSKQYSPL